MPRTQPDVGLHALDIIHKVLMIDAEWTSRANRQFTWWGHRLAQRVSASPCFESQEILISRIRVSVPLLDQVNRPPGEVMSILGYLNRMSVGHALVYREAERRIEAVLAHIVHEETVEGRAREIASNQIIMLAQCEQMADALAPLLKGQVAVRQHPLMGERPEPDDMLTVVERHYAPLGAEPNRFAVESEFKAIEAAFENSLAFSMGGDANGISLEVAFGEDDTTLIELSTTVDHPALGAGLGVFTTVRWDGTPEEVGAMANRLNVQLAEPFEVEAALGAWCIRDIGDQSFLAHGRFVPNADLPFSLLMNSALSAVSGAMWVDRLFFPGLEVRRAAEIVWRRMQGRKREQFEH